MSKANHPRSVIRRIRDHRRGSPRFLSKLRGMVGNVEAGVAATLRTIFTSAEQLESIDSVIATAGRVALAPCRGAAWCIKRLVPTRTGVALSQILSAVWLATNRSAVAAARAARPVWVRLLLVSSLALWPLWRPTSALVGFGRAWFITRSLRQVVWGVPALLLLLPVAGLSYVGAPRDNKVIVAGYRNALEAAHKVGDSTRSRLYERKLQQLGVSTARQAYERALAVADGGDLAEAYRAMSELAPANEVGYPPAHFWIARQAFAGELVGPDERGELVDRHLASLEAYGQHDAATQLLSGLRLVERGELEAARQKLEPLADDVPIAAATLLRLDLQLRRDDQVRHTAAAVVRHLERRQAHGQVFIQSDYALMSVALQIVGGAEAERERWLVEWRERYPDDPEATRQLRQLVEAKFERLLGASGSNPSELARLIQRASQLGSRSQWLDAQFQELYALRDRSVVASPLPEQVISQLLADEATSPVVLSSLGVQAARTAEWERAETCFRRVTIGEPANAVAWNNLAWVILQDGDAGRLEEACRIVDRAIELESGAYRFRETRGQIWLRLGNWERARADLEFARSGMPPTPSLEAALASVYAAMGGQAPVPSNANPPKKD